MCPRYARPLRHSPRARGGRARGVRLPGRTPLARSLKCPCDILLFVLVFERQRVGCVKGLLTLSDEHRR